MGLSRNSIWINVLAAMCLFSGAAHTAEVEQFAISRAYVTTRVAPPRVTVYLSAVDANGQPAVGLQGSSLSATLGSDSLKLSGVQPFDQSGEGVAYIFLIDVSGSIGPLQFSQMGSAIATWVDALRPADRVAVYAFGNECRRIVDFTQNMITVKTALDSLAPRDSMTQLHSALVQAMELVNRGDEGLPPRRVIVVLSDGKDEGSGRTAEDVLSQIRRAHMPIYAIGYSRLPVKERQQFLDVLHRFADNSGGIFREAGLEPLGNIYAEMHQSVLGVWVANFTCKQCQADGRAYPLQVTLTTPEHHTLTSNMDVLVPAQPPSVPWWKNWWVLAGVIVMSGIALVVVFAVRGGRQEEPPIAIALPQDDYLPTPAEPQGLRLRLAVIKGKHPGRTHEVRLVKHAVIGRKQECDVVLKDDDEISGRHCEIALVDGRVVVYDLQSRNGTAVNGVPITSRYRLESGDAILVGRTELRVTFGDGI